MELNVRGKKKVYKFAVSAGKYETFTSNPVNALSCSILVQSFHSLELYHSISEILHGVITVVILIESTGLSSSDCIINIILE